MASIATRLRREQRGWTLIELLVAMTLSVVMAGAAGAILVATGKSTPRTDSRTAAILKARSSLDRITRELRQGMSAPVATSSQVAVITYVRKAACGGGSGTTAIACRVTYTCSAGICTRTESQPDGTSPGPAVEVVRGLLGDAVFSYQPSAAAARWVGITFSFPAAGTAIPLTVADGAALRNPTGSG